MVRTKETNVAGPDEQKATQGTTEEGVSLTETMAERELSHELHRVVSMLVENALLGNVNYSRELGLSEKAGQMHASKREVPGVGFADAWLAEPEWVGESSEAQAETAAGRREPEE